jgi:hypothetical protein
MSHRACCHTRYTIQLMHYSHLKTQFPLSLDSGRHLQTYVKPEVAITVFELLMMSGVLLETC